MKTNEYRLPHGVADVMADTLISYFRNFHWMLLAGLIAAAPVGAVMMLLGPPPLIPNLEDMLMRLVAGVSAEAIALSLVLPVARRALAKEGTAESFISGQSLGRAGPLYVICALQFLLPVLVGVVTRGNLGIIALVMLIVGIFTMVVPAAYMFGTGGLLKAFPRGLALAWREPWLLFWLVLPIMIANGVFQMVSEDAHTTGKVPYEGAVMIVVLGTLFVMPFKATTIAAAYMRLQAFEAEDKDEETVGLGLEA